MTADRNWQSALTSFMPLSVLSIKIAYHLWYQTCLMQAVCVQWVTLARSGEQRVLSCMVGVALGALVYIRCRETVSFSNHVGQHIGDLGGWPGTFLPTHGHTCSPIHIVMGSLVGSKASLVACPEKMFLGTTSPHSLRFSPALRYSVSPNAGNKSPQRTGDPQVRAPDQEKAWCFSSFSPTNIAWSSSGLYFYSLHCIGFCDIDSCTSFMSHLSLCSFSCGFSVARGACGLLKGCTVCGLVLLNVHLAQRPFHLPDKVGSVSLRGCGETSRDIWLS